MTKHLRVSGHTYWRDQSRMVRVISVHHFTSQDVSSLSSAPLASAGKHQPHLFLTREARPGRGIQTSPTSNLELQDSVSGPVMRKGSFFNHTPLNKPMWVRTMDDMNKYLLPTAEALIDIQLKSFWNWNRSPPSCHPPVVISTYIDFK